MKQRDMVRALLHKAGRDEAVVARLLSDADLDDEIIGFHAQQAVEKALKAWLAHLGADYPKVHNLQTMLELLRSQGQTIPPAFEAVNSLTPFVTIFRYEDLPISAGFARKDALALVRTVLAYVRGIVENPDTET